MKAPAEGGAEKAGAERVGTEKTGAERPEPVEVF